MCLVFLRFRHGFYVTDDALVNIEYRKLVQDSDYTFDGFSLGFTIGFNFSY